MFKWLRRKLFPTFGEFVQDMYKDIDKERKKIGELGHYECENAHEWTSYESPTGSYCTERYGMTETRCPICKATICDVTFKDKKGKILWGGNARRIQKEKCGKEKKY